jgi:predicted Ser/Thr protein kinase
VLGELLSCGGVAKVHQGRDLRLGRDVAIKVLRTDLARDHIFQMRFRREAQNSAVLNHPRIAAVYDTGEEQAVSGEVLPYIVMEFVNGRTLREVIAAEGRLPPQRALEVAADVCAALEFSHRQGIIHRDVKPGNVMVTPNGQVKVLDFGIARDLSLASGVPTNTYAAIGTLRYMAPEQLTGEVIDQRCDVYAVGCVLWEMLTGRPVFDGPSGIVYYQKMRDFPVLPSHLVDGIPAMLDAVVVKAMAAKVVDRYRDVAALRTELLEAARPADARTREHAVRLAADPASSLPPPEFATFADALSATTTVTGGWLPPATTNLEVRIGDVPLGATWTVTVSGTEGEVAVPLRPFDEGHLGAAHGRFLRALDMARINPHLPGQDEERAVQVLGALLFDCLLPGEARMLYRTCRAASRREGRYLRVVLRIRPPDLAALPWEFMYDEEFGMFPCLEHPIVRHVEQALPIDALGAERPLELLGMVATPRDREPLDVAAERTAVERALRSLVDQGHVRLSWVNGQTWQDLQRKLHKRQYHAFHFIGHGGFDPARDESHLVLADSSGSSEPLPASDVAALLAGQHALRLVLLNCCESARKDGRRSSRSVAEALVRRGVNTVLAMQHPVSDPAATRFALTFYDALAAWTPIDVAVTMARYAVKRRGPGSLEWGTPVLFLRSRTSTLLRPPGGSS